MPKLIASDGSQLLLQGEEVSVGRRDAAGHLACRRRPGQPGARADRLASPRAHFPPAFRPGTCASSRASPTKRKVAGKALKAGEEALLSDGDEILLGAVTLTFRADVDPEVTLVRQAQAPAELRSDGLVWPLAAPEGRRLWIGRPRAG